MIVKGQHQSPPPLAKLPRKGYYKEGFGIEVTPPQSPPTMPPHTPALQHPMVGKEASQQSFLEKVQRAQSFLPECGRPGVPKVKCVLVGDGAIGKTSLVVSYTTNGYPTEYEPTAFDNYAVEVTVDNRPVRLQLCDTAGQDDFDSLRPLCYPNTDIFLLCFSVVLPSSFHNVLDKWLPEIHHNCPKAPIILVGTQCDLRSDVKELIELAKYNERPILEEEARQRAQDIGALHYIECSALTQKNLKEVFDTVILAGLDKNGLLRKSSSKKKWKKEKKKMREQETIKEEIGLNGNMRYPDLNTKKKKVPTATLR